MAMFNNNQRSDLKMSDFRSNMKENNSGAVKFSDLGVFNRTTGTSTPNYYNTGNYAYRTGEYYLSARRSSTLGGGNVALADPCLIGPMHGRYRSSTPGSAPSNTALVYKNSGNSPYTGLVSNLNIGRYTGITDFPIPTDTCGQTRGVGGGYSNAYTAVRSPSVGGGAAQHAMFHADGSDTSSAHQTTTGKEATPDLDNIIGDWVNTSYPYLGQADTGVNQMAYSVTQTYHNNQWTHIKLNTVCTTGDRVVVVVQSGGGTMYTFSSYGPIYLRTAGNSAVSATVSTHYGPTKNESGTDSWVAVYSAVCNASGATMVGVNPFHSTTMTYQFHTFVIKGPNTGIARVQRVKYNHSNTASDSGGRSSSTILTYANTQYNGNRQPFFVTITASSFWSNGHNTRLTGINTGPSTANFRHYTAQSNATTCDMQSPVSTIYQGAWYVSITCFKGGHGQFSNFLGKANNPGWVGYTPSAATKSTKQHSDGIFLGCYRY